MTNTKLSDVATKVALSAGGERRKSALGNGTAKAGDAVGINHTNGKVVGADAGSSELFEGFVDIRYDTDMDSAIPDGSGLEIIIPQSRHTYAVHVEEPGGTYYEGQPYMLSDTEYTFEDASTFNTAGVRAVLDQSSIVTGETYAKLRWL